jgi:hypothetical protein
LTSDSPVTERESAEPVPPAEAKPGDLEPEPREDDLDVSTDIPEEVSAELEQAAASPLPEETVSFQPSTSSWRSSFGWLIVVLGYATSAVAGLGLGYLILRWLAPDSNLLLPW